MDGHVAALAMTVLASSELALFSAISGCSELTGQRSPAQPRARSSAPGLKRTVLIARILIGCLVCGL